MRVTTEILKPAAVLAAMLSLALAQPARALAGTVPAAPSAAAGPAPVLPDSPPPEAATSIASYLYSSPSAARSGRWTTEFQDGASLKQRGVYSANGLSLLAEMGEISISETPNTVHGLSGKGGRLAVSTGSGGNALRLQTFASSGAGGSGSGGMLFGATGEISILSDAARFKTILFSGRQSLQQGLQPLTLGEKRGDVVGLVATVEPFKGRLAAEAELDFSIFDRDTADDVEAIRDSALRLQLGGELGRYRYKALYERTGPDYRLFGAKGPKRDSEGVSLGVETSLGIHAFDVKLSRYHNNTRNEVLKPRLYRFEGLLDYTFKAIDDLPLGLRYKKIFVDSAQEPAGYLPSRSEEEAVAGKVNYLRGRWDLGLLASYSQRTDLIRDEREATSTTFSFLPKYAAGELTVTPDFSLQRSVDVPASQRTARYAVGLGITGSALEKRLDYQLNGAFKKEMAATGFRKETVGANVKAAYPVLTLFKKNWQPSFGISGEYSGITDPAALRRENAFTFLFSVEGKSLL